MSIFWKKKEKQIQAEVEGARVDVLTPGVIGGGSGGTIIDKNNYPTYTKQVKTINDMYNSRTDYAGEILRSVIDTRVSFIAGAGVSVRGKTKKTVKWATEFLKINKMLKGSNLFRAVKIGDMEGKILAKIEEGKQYEEKYVKTILVDWCNNPYNVVMENGEITKIMLSDREELDKTTGKKEIPTSEAVYFKLGGSPDRVNETPPKISNILTDIENMSRAKYDMRGNNHLYARPQWVGLTNTAGEAKALNNTINGQDMQRSKSYVGTAKDIFYLEPSGKAQEVLEKEILLSARIISMNTGIPIHWLAWPDLMSNRATAENMLEVINSATIQERLILEEGLTELIRKAMVYAFERGHKGAVNDPFGFEVKVDLISYANLKQLSETYIPLADMEYISKQTAMSLIPGIDPAEELAQIEREKEKRIEDMPTILQKKGVDDEQEETEPNEEE